MDEKLLTILPCIVDEVMKKNFAEFFGDRIHPHPMYNEDNLEPDNGVKVLEKVEEFFGLNPKHQVSLLGFTTTRILNALKY